MVKYFDAEIVHSTRVNIFESKPWDHWMVWS